jgi:hypothetical protein
MRLANSTFDRTAGLHPLAVAGQRERYARPKGETMSRFVLFFVMSLLLSGCVTGERVRGGVQEGMSKQQVISELGNPDGFQRSGEYKALLYTNRLISGWSWDRTDYTIVLQNGRVVQYGTGQVRQNGPNMLILVPLR